MEKGLIRLLYRKIIDAGSQDPWEQLVFEETYKEFLMQAQRFNPERKYHTFAGLINNVPGANQLSFLISPAVTGYLKQLNGKMPNIVNVTGRHFMPFKSYRFEMINSDIRDKTRHQVGINFISEPLTWYDTIGDKLLVSAESRMNEQNEILTEMFVMQPFLSIYCIKPNNYDVNAI